MTEDEWPLDYSDPQHPDYDPKQCCSHRGQYAWWEYDARGIEIAKVCDKCVKHKLAGYRPEVLTDYNYECDEPIEAEEY